MTTRLIIVCLVFIITLTASIGKGGDVIKHWERPFAVNGGDYSSAEKVLPNNCSTCHKSQFNDWSNSFHRKSTGPGLLGQLDIKNNPEFAQSCYFCHAPAKEQFKSDISYNKNLHKEGVSCTICHMRGGTVYGPKSRSGDVSIALYAHKTKEESFFSDSKFCAACHQMDEGFSLNGKILTNTYGEWKESKYFKLDINCQTCHMPDRKHLFKGIHDKEMTLSALTINVERREDRVVAIIKNIGAGHYFPTYVTPLVIVRAYLKGGDGEVLGGTSSESYIGRVVLANLEKEVMDTRIPPDGQFEFSYNVPKEANEGSVIVEIHVHPDMFYKHFFKESLSDGNYTKKSYIEEALKNTESTPYLLFSKEIAL